MGTKRMSILFRVKKPTHYEHGNVPIYLRITLDSERTEISINREFDPKRWNQTTGRAIGTKEDARSLNDYLESLQLKLYELHRSFNQNEEEYTLQQLKNKFLGRSDEKPKLLLDVFTDHNRQLLQLVSTDEYAKGTHTHFETTLRHVKEFLAWKFQLTDLSVKKVDYGFLSDFEHYLKLKVCKHNTAMKYLGDLKKVLLVCVKRSWIEKDPFLGYKMTRRQVQTEFLVEEELQAIIHKQFSSERLELVRHIFLFSCYTGLAYADVAKLKRSEVRKGIDQELWLFIQRQKSTTPAAVPLLPTAMQIIERYACHPKCQHTDRVLPILCNQKMNAYLKEIADVCGIQKRLTFHTARHTFATTVTLNNDVPIESVSKMLGHRSLKQTQHYAKILNKKVAEDMKRLRRKLGG